jgi:eukaryotic-like serine/threonine-protein kinase
MELLRGKDLRHSLAAGWRPSVSDAALIMRRVADALSYAHHRGVIHRDIKPANIFMVSRTHPKVLDFGIARIRQVEATANDGVSRFGDLVGGSPYYMSPEQIRHDSVDRRADVYAMGVVLYELLTGRKPFSGTDLDAILAAVLTQPLIPPHELDPRVPQALSEVVMRAMARDPSARTRSARLFSQELRVWLDGQAGVVAVDDQTATGAGGGSTVNRKAPRAAVREASPAAATASDWPRYGRYGAILAGVCVVTVASWLGWRHVAKSPAQVAAASAPAPAAVKAETTAQPPALPPVALAPTETVVAAPLVAPLEVPASANGSVPAVQPPLPLQPAPPPVVRQDVIAPKPVVKPTGTLFLAISPWGRVSVDGRAVGVAPPLTQLTLPEGKHTVTIKNDESPAFTQSIQVEAGQGVTVTHAF